MKQTVIAALMLNLGVAGVYAQQTPIRMTFSGTGAPTAIDLKYPNTKNGEESLAGSGTLGSFTFRMVEATANAPQPSTTCSGLFFQTVAGAGLFRFQDGSLLSATITQGGDCIDFVHLVAHCTWTFKITGGTGRFQDASGVLTLTETSTPALTDAMNNPVFFTETGEFTGTISGVGGEDDRPEERR
jgi:hypothetical protein